MTFVASFAPVEGAGARVLILGSMPGVASLAAGRYYAHPRNSFWKIMAAVLQFSPELEYGQRIAALQSSGIVLWDVLQSCARPGSLDAAIDAGTVTANDIPALLRRQPGIQTVCFNGITAERYYRKHVLPQLPKCAISYSRLPSTSPANASLSLQVKTSAWRTAVCSAPGPGALRDVARP